VADPDLTRSLADIRPFDEAPAEVLSGIRSDLSIRALEPGDELFLEGQDIGSLAVVVTGRLAVHVGAPTAGFEVAEVGEGEVVGEITALLGGERTGVVAAMSASEVLMIAAPGVAMLAAGAPRVIDHLFKTATQRLRETQLAAVLARHFGLIPRGSVTRSSTPLSGCPSRPVIDCSSRVMRRMPPTSWCRAGCGRSMTVTPVRHGRTRPSRSRSVPVRWLGSRPCSAPCRNGHRRRNP